MELTAKQKKYLKALAHHLSPAVQMGKAGYGAAFVRETDRNLKDHELIKVKVSVEDREELDELTETLAKETRSSLVQVIGHTVVLYREADEPKIKLPSKTGVLPVEKPVPKLAKKNVKKQAVKNPSPAKKKVKKTGAARPR